MAGNFAISSSIPLGGEGTRKDSWDFNSVAHTNLLKGLGFTNSSYCYEYDTSDNVYTSRDYRYDLEIMTGIWNKK